MIQLERLNVTDTYGYYDQYGNRYLFMSYKEMRIFLYNYMLKHMAKFR